MAASMALASEHSNLCKVGGLWSMVGHHEEKLRNFRATKHRFSRWEDCPRTAAEIERYARVLAEVPVAESR